MKVAHLNKQAEVKKQVQGTLREQLEAGKALESEKDFDAAIRLYSTILKKKPLNESVYNRLMILFRKTKDYRSELKIVDEAIKNFQEHGASVSKKHGGAIGRLSRSIGKSTGLLDQKGNSVYDPEPIATWKKRKLVIRKKLKTA